MISVFKALRIYWRMNQALSKVCYSYGERDKQLVGKIIAKDELGDKYSFMEGEQRFLQEVDVYRKRYVEDAAVMILISTAAAWKAVDHDIFSSYCNEAAMQIGLRYYKSDEKQIADFMSKQFQKELESRMRVKKRT